jgi:hypothetical protein
VTLIAVVIRAFASEGCHTPCLLYFKLCKLWIY